jgi:hypothetical protein
MNNTTRFLVPAVLVALIYGGLWTIQGRGMPTECDPPQRSLAELPRTLDTPGGPWVGESVPMDPEMFAHTGAEEIVDLTFQRSASEVVLLHSAVYLVADLSLPHPPRECYIGAGHQLVAEEDLEIAVPGQPAPVRARLLTADREGQRAYVLYWYQIGDRVVLDRDDVRDAAKILRGKETWPPRLKMMLHTNQTDRGLAIEQLQSVAAPLMAWAKTFR